jgi:hypothetical protein
MPRSLIAPVHPAHIVAADNLPTLGKALTIGMDPA